MGNYRSANRKHHAFMLFADVLLRWYHIRSYYLKTFQQHVGRRLRKHIRMAYIGIHTKHTTGMGNLFVGADSNYY